MSDLIERLKKRAEIRRQIPSRKSVANGEPDRISDLLEEAALAIETIIKIPVDHLLEVAEKFDTGNGCGICLVRCAREIEAKLRTVMSEVKEKING